MVDLGEDEEKFDAFMIPITQSFESLGQVLLNSGSSEIHLPSLDFTSVSLSSSHQGLFLGQKQTSRPDLNLDMGRTRKEFATINMLASLPPLLSK